MDDLISRKAAIDALENAGMTNYQATGDFYGIINALTVIKNMPTAEPEIIRCKDCYHYPSEYSDCPMIEWFRHEDDYCSRVERRSDG